MGCEISLVGIELDIVDMKSYHIDQKELTSLAGKRVSGRALQDGVCMLKISLVVEPDFATAGSLGDWDDQRYAKVAG